MLGLDVAALPAQATDPEARWGRGSRGEWVYGCKLHLLLELDTGEILALSVTPAHRRDGPVDLALARGMKRLEGVKPSLLLADSAYDAEELFQAAEGKGLLLLSGYNRRRGSPGGRGGRTTCGGFGVGPTVSCSDGGGNWRRCSVY